MEMRTLHTNLTICVSILLDMFINFISLLMINDGEMEQSWGIKFGRRDIFDFWFVNVDFNHPTD
ncbi:hypothetical protein Lal_00031152 [Lupinus albus]|nr:hypothetical protein Lal_00031152 [Lupinus albus]